MLKWKKIHSIDVVGTSNTFIEKTFVSNNISNDFVLRFEQIPPKTLYMNYLIVSYDIEKLSHRNSSKIDIFSLGQSDFLQPYILIKKLRKLNRKNIGIEIRLSHLRKSNTFEIGKWIKCIDDIYKFCKLNNCQIIFSSGARSQSETISSNTFDSILSICNIESNQYWKDLEKWLDSKTKVYEYGT